MPMSIIFFPPFFIRNSFFYKHTSLQVPVIQWNLVCRIIMFSKGSAYYLKVGLNLSTSEIYRLEHVSLASAFTILAITTAILCQLLVSASLFLFIMVTIIGQWLQLAGWAALAVASLLMTSLGVDRACGMPGNHFCPVCTALTERCSRAGTTLGLVALQIFLGKAAASW